MPTVALFWIPVHLRLCVGLVRGGGGGGHRRRVRRGGGGEGGLVKKRERYFTSYL